MILSCSDNTNRNNHSYTLCDSDSERNNVPSQTRVGQSSSNFASQTVRVVMEEIGVQTVQVEEESRNEERKEEDRNELAKLRVSLIEAKVGWFYIYQS